MMKITKFVFIAAILFIFTAACTREEWLGVFYPNKDDLTVTEIMGTFATIADCRQSAANHIKATKNQNADYECRLNCDMSKGPPYSCEKIDH